MAYYPDVQPGDKFQPNALLANDVRHLLNRMDGFTGGVSKATRQNYTTIKVYSDEMLRPGDGVNFIDGEMIQGAVPCELYWDRSRPWGVIFDWIKPHGFGHCIVGGAATLNIYGNCPQYARPGIWDMYYISSVNGATLLSPDSEVYKINDERGEQPYEGYFKVEIEESGENSFQAKVVMGGIAKRSYCGTVIYNDKMIEIPEKSVSITKDIVALGLKIKFISNSKLEADVVRFVNINNYVRPENGEPFTTWYYPSLGYHEWWGHMLCYFKWRELTIDNVVKNQVCITNQDLKIYEPQRLKNYGT